MQTLRVDSNESVYVVDKYIVVIGGNVRPGFWHHKDWSYLVAERPMLALPEGEPEETPEHYHVVAFINGCLNDHDSGPYDTLEDARIALAEYVETEATYSPYEWESAGVDRFVQVNGVYIAAIEPCSEAECYESLF
jgi:hypothetical protein